MYNLRFFDEHSGYTEYMDGEVMKPNVSFCEEENHVHYKPLFDPILPENLQVWEEYQQWICDDEEIARDREIFTTYPVNMNTSTNYISFTYNINEIESYYRRVRTSPSSSSDTLTTNDCGKTYKQIYEWEYDNGLIT